MNINKKVILLGLIVFLMTFGLIGCVGEERRNDRSTNEKEVSDNINQADIEVDKYKEKISELNNELGQTIQERDRILEFLDNSRVMEVSDTSLYRLRSNYYNDLFIQETILDTNKQGFYLQKENIYNFKVSNDNKYVVVSFFDMKNLDEQYLILYDHSGNEMFRYSINDIKNQLSKLQYDGRELIIFDGFSSNNKYLYGGLAAELDRGAYFSINIETGELTVYSTLDYDEYKKLLEEYPVTK